MKHLPGEQAVLTWARLIRLQSHLLDRVHAALKTADLPPLAWYDVLLELHRSREAGLRPYEISRRTLLPKYNLSRLIDRLEGEDLVGRDACAGDRRGNVVRITAKGSRLLKRMWPVYGAVIQDELESKLTPEEVSALGGLLDRLLRDPAGRPAEGGDSGPTNGGSDSRA